MRFVRSLLTFGFALFSAALVAAVLLLFLGATGRSPIALRFLSANLAKVFAGQQIDQMTLEVDVEPAARRLSGVAQLDVRAVDADRQRIYFLLSNGLRVERVWMQADGGQAVDLAPLQMWMVTAVELPQALPAGASVRLGVAYSGDPMASVLPLGGGVLEGDEVLLQPEDLWYPLDLQSFANFDVTVTLPQRLTLIHNGNEISRTDLGTSRRVRWTSTRPRAGAALVAAAASEHSIEREGTRYRLFLPFDIDLDADRILAALATANADLASYFGPSGFAQLTAVVSRRAPRSSFDGSGVVTLRDGALRSGDYGIGVLTHEVAHAWWGGTVAGRWLQPDAGSQWLVEGFAGAAAWWSMGRSYGDDAAFEQRARAAFDPARAVVLNAPTAIDNRVDPSVRDAIYDKGAYVAFMLQQRLGEETFGEAARQFLDRYRYQAASARDLEAVFSAVAGQDLTSFFADWVYSDQRLDLALEPREGDAVVVNRQSAAPPLIEIPLWRTPGGTEPERQTLAVGGTTPVGNVERLILDPRALLADMYRDNNVLPRAERPRRVARSSTGGLFVVEGEPHPWMPARVREIDAAGNTLHVWDFDRGLLRDPLWSADGTRVIAVETARGGRPNAYALHPSDGSQRAIGHEIALWGTAEGLLVARGREIRAVGGERETTVARVERGRITAALPAPDGRGFAYAAVAGRRMELRFAAADGSGDRLLLTWNGGPLDWVWSPDASRLFAVLGGDWDWQVWELPLDGAPRPVIREAAAIRALAVSPDGSHLAVVALPAPDPARTRFELFVLERGTTAEAQRFNLSGNDCHDVAWLDDENLLVVVSDVGAPALPEERQLRKLRLADASLLAFP